MKILEKDKINDQKDVERITREIKILKKVRHPNVIQLYEVSTVTPALSMLIDHRNREGAVHDYGTRERWRVV